ncbi:MAG: sigma-70 family RNA polymerase sigma factor [Verrucomicrobia bacterium]|nr:sigma-70 family RNA polymerase sigma factor [Verrucomicrobiota bacterium]MBV8280297.1 sigma-70 family RNA polymerase sigma factor [Verrucomicrobiota bacterium]
MEGWLSSSAGGQLRFETTHWSVVCAAGGEGEQRRDALEDLYHRYCYPVYSFIRRRGHNRQDAQDLTHDFFIYLLEKDGFNRAAAGQGKFRTFLLRALEFFLSHAGERARTQKRGGRTKLVFLDDEAAEGAYQLIDPGLTAEQLFDAQWAMMLIESTFARLKLEMEQAGRRELYDQLSGFLLGGEETSYVEVAQRIGLTVAATKAAIYRLRVRYREILRAEVARTVASSTDFDAEIRALQASLLNGSQG